MEVLKGIRDAYGKAILQLGREDHSIVTLVTDSKLSSKLSDFEKDFPDRVYELGIAEQNMIGIAAGLAVSGKTVFVSAIANFACMRCFEQIRTSIAYPRLNVKIIALSAGFAYPYLGATHTCLEDLAIMRAIPNMTVISPADEIETIAATRAIASYKGPVFMRLGRQPVPTIYDEGYCFEIGKAVTVRDGSDLTLVSTGAMVHLCLDAAERLAKQGVKARVINLPTIKPIDKKVLIQAARETGAIVSVEEHNLPGGLGSAVAEVLCESAPTVLKRIGVPDAFTVPGPRDGVLKRFGLTTENIVSSALALSRAQKSTHSNAAQKT